MAIDYNDVYYSPGWATVLPSAARTATPNQQQLKFQGDWDGAVLVVDMTAVTATGTVTVKIEGVDPTSGKTYTILQSTALAAAATTVLRVHPNLPASANLTAQDILPPVIRVTATHGNAVSMTYSIGLLLAN